MRGVRRVVAWGIGRGAAAASLGRASGIEPWCRAALIVLGSLVDSVGTMLLMLPVARWRRRHITVDALFTATPAVLTGWCSTTPARIGWRQPRYPLPSCRRGGWAS
jgi:hypothetical protein